MPWVSTQVQKDKESCAKAQVTQTESTEKFISLDRLGNLLLIRESETCGLNIAVKCLKFNLLFLNRKDLKGCK